MSLWDRLGNVLKSYINDVTEQIPGEDRPRQRYGDDDYDAAYKELDDFLKGDAPKPRDEPPNVRNARPIPPELKADFAELGLPFGASAESCKEAYKRLLKLHHPDRHAGHAENMRKATEKSARINAAFDRIEKWYKTTKRNF